MMSELASADRDRGSSEKTTHDFVDFIATELKPRLSEDVWKSTVEFLQSKCKQGDETRDLLIEEDVSCQAESWLRWAQSHKKVKVVSAAVPGNILPPGFSGRLLDAKVFSRGPDDVVYDENEELRKKVARGNCFLELTSGSKTSSQCVIYALKKFTGGLGDDDDRDKGDDFTWKMYFTKPLDDCKSVVCTTKANGEAAHLSAVSIGGQYYFCAGSKNVHMIFRNKDDVDKYDTKNMRYTVAREICHCLLAMFESLLPERRNRLLEFLAVTRLTAVFEILNPETPHVEDLSSLPSAQMKFITWTSLDLTPTDDAHICWLAPDVSVEVARVFGLSTVEYCVIDATEIDDRMKKIRHYHTVEGEVLFFMDSNRNVIGMLKKKSIWYIIVRAIREKVRRSLNNHAKGANTLNLKTETKRIETRITEIQKWLGFDDETLEFWKSLGTDFLNWILQEVQNSRITSQEAITKFPVHWQRFLDEEQRTDSFTGR